MKLLLSSLLAVCFIWVKAQAPTAQALVNTYRSKNETSANRTLAECNYIRTAKDSVNGSSTFFVYTPSKPKPNENNSIVVFSKYYYLTYYTKLSLNFDSLKKEIGSLGFQEQNFSANINIDGRIADLWQFIIPGDYTICITAVNYKNEGLFQISVGQPH